MEISDKFRGGDGQQTIADVKMWSDGNSGNIDTRNMDIAAEEMREGKQRRCGTLSVSIAMPH